MAYIVTLAYRDPLFNSGTVYVSLTTNTTASLVLNTHFYLLAVDIFTSVVDCLRVIINRKHAKL